MNVNFEAIEKAWFKPKKDSLDEKILNELEYYLEKIIIDSKAGSSQQFYYKNIYDFIQELKKEIK